MVLLKCNFDAQRLRRENFAGSLSLSRTPFVFQTNPTAQGVGRHGRWNSFASSCFRPDAIAK